MSDTELAADTHTVAGDIDGCTELGLLRATSSQLETM